jgi:alkylhydroperoxidase/carboxymuconolactone decarboxylase family protein YurZ
MDHEHVYPPATKEMSQKRASLALEMTEAFRNFSRTVFEDGALPEKNKAIDCRGGSARDAMPHCICGHAKQATRKGATQEKIMEAIWGASEMRAGAAYAHVAIALSEMNQEEKPW